MTSSVSQSPVVSNGEEALVGLEGVCVEHGLSALANRLAELRAWLADDLAEVEAAVGATAKGDTLAHASASHLLAQHGKRLRPICVMLAARAGAGFTSAARVYAVTVELVHNATLLHDDVVDLGDTRRGAPAACVVYGNAASIFGGDWLLVDALRRIQAVDRPHVLARMLEVIQEMVIAESLQLARRGQIRADRREYFRIIEGKTASLFRWAMFAGADAGGVDLGVSQVLEAYGANLGTAFQLVDDLLDFEGDPAATGKSLLADVREGKMTYPLIVAMERDPKLALELEAHCGPGMTLLPPDLAGWIGRAITQTGAHDECLAVATRYCKDAVTSLAALPESSARAALEAVAMATLRRKR